MKKLLQNFFVAMLLSAVAINSYAYKKGESLTIDGFTYSITDPSTSNPTLALTSAATSTIVGGKVTVPSTVFDGKDMTFTVTSLANSCSFPESATELDLPETLTRIGEFIDHYTYGNIKFGDDDKQHNCPIVTELNDFTRSKTNCIIFNIKEKYNKKYDKLFVYQTLNRENQYYGIVGIKENKKPVHIYFLELDYSILVINMFRMIKNNVIK